MDSNKVLILGALAIGAVYMMNQNKQGQQSQQQQLLQQQAYLQQQQILAMQAAQRQQQQQSSSGNNWLNIIDSGLKLVPGVIDLFGNKNSFGSLPDYDRVDNSWLFA